MNKQLLDRYAAGPEIVRAMARGLDEAELTRPIGPGTWSIKQVIVHLLDSDLIATHRMRRIAAEELPLLIAYDENRFAERLNDNRLDIGVVCDLFDLNRRFTLDFLGLLPADTFAREGIHSARGKVTIPQIVEMYAHHVDHHLTFVRGKRETMGKPM